MDHRYFEQMYADDADPWGFEERWYEQRKYALTLAALPREHYASAFEPGCSIGVLSAQLAERCDRLTAWDIVPSAVVKAKDRLANTRHVTIEQRAVPDEWPDEVFDLIVLSEVVYYFDEEAAERLRDRAVASAMPDATLVAVHWRGETNYPLSGDEAHRLIDSAAGLQRVAHHVEPEFLIDVWRCVP
jgi:protein-L-isoaspartate O-methyltransferase